MLRLIGIFVLLFAAVVGLGWYLGWFQVATKNSDQKTNINITVDKDKIREDEEKAKEKLQDVGKK